MHRYFVTGTDTDVGKTRVTAALALALRLAGERPTIVKLVQTGLGPGVAGDAARAGNLAGTPWRELARLERAADPWSAAVAQGAAQIRARELAEGLRAIGGALVAEGSGGVMVPLGESEHIGHVAVMAGLQAIVVVGLRLGCLNHALLTLNLCEQLGIPVAGGVLVERWGPTQAVYRDDVTRVLQGKLRIVGILPFAPDEAAGVRAGAKLFDGMVTR